MDLLIEYIGKSLFKVRASIKVIKLLSMKQLFAFVVERPTDNIINLAS